jgi:hypothetical protein
MLHHRFSIGALCAVFLLSGLGCGGRLVKVQGVVKLDGQPVEGAVVVFENDGQEGRPAVGQTDSDGIFYLGTFKSEDGALRGNYKVTIMPPQAFPKVVGFEGITFAEAMAQYSQGKKELENQPPLPGSNIPTKYRNPAQTPLRQKVPPDGPVVFDLASEGGGKPAPVKKARTDPFEPRKK